MAGYKSTLRTDGAIAMWSFDGDQFDQGNRNLVSDQMIMLDEIENRNPALLHVASFDPPHGYRMGVNSLVGLEPSNQYSCCFGYNGKVSGTYTKAFLEVPHSVYFAFDKEFTIEFLMRKATETQYRTDNPYASFSRPIIKKSQVFNCYYDYNYGTSSQGLNVWFPSGNTSRVDFSSFLDDIVHVVITWRISLVETGTYQATEKVYLDGRTYYSATKTYYDTYPNINVNTPFEIAGTIAAGTNFSDRQTAALYLDQITVFGSYFTAQQVGRHYKKVYSYDQMILNQRPSQYWALNETNSLVDWSIGNMVSGGYGSGEYIGTVNTLNRGISGPSNLPGSSAVYFGSDTAAFIGKSTSNYNTPISVMNINGSYTVEFWFNTKTVKRGVLFTSAQDKPPFNGVTIEINRSSDGVITFIETSGVVLSSETGNWNDEKWHHCCVRRSGSDLSLWLDGNLQASLLNIPQVSSGYTGWVKMMNSAPGDLQVVGSLCKVAIYGYAIEQHQIEIRRQYTSYYWIRGITTLQGIPTKETIRIYNHYTGALIAEISSDNNSGEYFHYLPNNSLVDVLVFNKDDQSVRYRAYGPIEPASCLDSYVYP